MAKFRPGQSGNPRGRPRGSGIAAHVRQSLHGDLPEVLQAIVDAAKKGDMAAAKLLLDRVVPTLKPVDLPVVLPEDERLSDQGRSVLQAAASGSLSPEQADRLLSAIARQSRVVEVDEIVRRLEVLEGER
jgi:hypothetical protein